MADLIQSKIWVGLICLGVSGQVAAMPQQFSALESEGREAGLAFSNDAHFLTLSLLPDEDRYYTQGLHLFWAGRPQKISEAWTPVRQVGAAIQASYVATHIRLGQEVFTPNDIQAVPPLVTDDRPFVGWTHLDLGQRLYYKLCGHATRLHLQLNFGLVGPLSLADVTQIEFHRVRRQTSAHPELDPDPSAGWVEQYGAEGFPVRAQMVLNQAWSVFDKRFQNKFGFDLGVEAQADIGTIYGNLGTALQLRIGRLTRALYLPMENGNGKSWETFGFARSEIKAVGWNEVLSGAQSHGVLPAMWLWQNEFGIALRGPAPFPEISLSGSMWSRETKAKSNQPFQPGHIDYRPELQKRRTWFDHGFGTVRLNWYW